MKLAKKLLSMLLVISMMTSLLVTGVNANDDIDQMAMPISEQSELYIPESAQASSRATYASYYNINVSTEAELLSALSSYGGYSNVIINLQNDITIDADAQIALGNSCAVDVFFAALNGNNHTLTFRKSVLTSYWLLYRPAGAGSIYDLNVMYDGYPCTLAFYVALSSTTGPDSLSKILIF